MLARCAGCGSTLCRSRDATAGGPRGCDGGGQPSGPLLCCLCHAGVAAVFQRMLAVPHMLCHFVSKCVALRLPPAQVKLAVAFQDIELLPSRAIGAVPEGDNPALLRCAGGAWEGGRWVWAACSKDSCCNACWAALSTCTRSALSPALFAATCFPCVRACALSGRRLLFPPSAPVLPLHVR